MTTKLSVQVSATTIHHPKVLVDTVVDNNQLQQQQKQQEQQQDSIEIQKEIWTIGNTFTNHWSSPTYTIPLVSNSGFKLNIN
jgi:hypothetical protein